jgi:hypothetical protein
LTPEQRDEVEDELEHQQEAIEAAEYVRDIAEKVVNYIKDNPYIINLLIVLLLSLISLIFNGYFSEQSNYNLSEESNYYTGYILCDAPRA